MSISVVKYSANVLIKRLKLLTFIYYLTLCTFSPCEVHAQDSSWARFVIDDSHSGADGVRLTDINKDGLPDITTGWEEGGYTKLYLHPGFDRVKTKWPSVIVGRTPDVEDAVFADVDDDGILDIVSSTEGNSKMMYVNWGPKDADYLDSTKWTTESITTSVDLMQWMFAIPMDVDGRNGIDLIVGAKGKNAAIGWFESPIDPRTVSAWNWHAIGPATWVMSLILRDMDRDGDMDIVTSDRKPGPTRGVRWLENPGRGTAQKEQWQSHFIGARSREVMFMDMADLDGDGLEDAVVAEYTHQKIVFMRRLDETGLHWQESEISIPEITGRAKAVRIGDINGDGTLDIVLSTNTLEGKKKVGIVWLARIGGDNKLGGEWYNLSGRDGYKFDRIELLDIDGDGDLDVLTCEENFGPDSRGLGVIWYENPTQN